jgi:hypothetical protein
VNAAAVVRRLAALPLAAWAGLLCGGAVLLSLLTTGVLLRSSAPLSADAEGALAAGAVVGLLLTTVAVLAAGRLAASLTRLRSYAVHRLDGPPPATGRPATG